MSSQKRVLIVDDSMVMRAMIKDVLTKDGFEVVGQAKNGKEALEQYQQLRPDLVTMDIIMPGEHGTDVVKRLVELDKDARIVVVSGLNQKSLVMQAMDNGAREFLVKPFENKDLLEAARKTAR
ncbi:response regulator [Methanomassiliicoccus luminyensis]|uniref:response regulator n=1 Tax=Methanomassiliicoccus luminyensis TaxID=1080712 RepID=UPI0003701A20|nr:response regulator [Methanomassiliicoccus luminyensis]